jgi:hypothetical protein
MLFRVCHRSKIIRNQNDQERMGVRGLRKRVVCGLWGLIFWAESSGAQIGVSVILGDGRGGTGYNPVLLGMRSGGEFGAGEVAVVGFVGGDEAGCEGVVGDVLELFVEFVFVAEDAVEGFGLPEGALGLAVGVDFLRSATLYALHDSRKRIFLDRLQDQMDVIGHDDSGNKSIKFLVAENDVFSNNFSFFRIQLA